MRASAEWVVDERGQCVRVWTWASLFKGPEAMLDSPLVPIRFALGGIVEAVECPDEECGVFRKTLLGTGGVMLGLVFGTFNGFFDAVSGFSDTLTAGHLGWSADDPTRLSLWPIRFVMLGDTCCFFGRPYDYTRDRCGRTVLNIPPSDRWWEPPWWRRL